MKFEIGQRVMPYGYAKDEQEEVWYLTGTTPGTVVDGGRSIGQVEIILHMKDEEDIRFRLHENQCRKLVKKK